MYYTRSKALEYRAAGVMPFAVHNEQLVALLGAELCRTGPGGKVWRHMWRDFGGARESVDACSAATAAREFAEETLGMFACCTVTAQAVEQAAASMQVQLESEALTVKVVHSLKRGHYHMYVTQTPFIAPLMFKMAKQQNASTGAIPGGDEKSAFAWVPLRDLLQCVAQPSGRYMLEARSAACGGAGTPPPCRNGRRRFLLHPCFANSLRMAQQRGLDAVVARAHSLPLPPPAPLPSLAEGGPAHRLPLLPPALVAAADRSTCAAELGMVAGDHSEGVPVLGTAACSGNAAIAAAAPAADLDEGEEESGSWKLQGLGWWLQQAEVAAHLHSRSGNHPGRTTQQFSPPRQSGEALAVDDGLAVGMGEQPPPQQRQLRPQPAPSVSGSVACSMDTASSLQSSKAAAEAAAAAEVVEQIVYNTRNARRKRSRRQRQQQRRRRRRMHEQQQEEEQREQGEQEAQEVPGSEGGGVVARRQRRCGNDPRTEVPPKQQRQQHQQQQEAAGEARSTGAPQPWHIAHQQLLVVLPPPPSTPRRRVVVQ